MDLPDHNEMVLVCDKCGADQSLSKKKVVRQIEQENDNPDKRIIVVCRCGECGHEYWHHASLMLLEAYEVLHGHQEPERG